MSYFGAKVVHAKTIRPCIEQGIPLRICNTFQPEVEGTVVQGDGSGMMRCMSSEDLSSFGVSRAGKGYKAVTSINGCKLVTIAGRGMIGVLGVAARAFAAVAKANASVLLITQGLPPP